MTVLGDKQTEGDATNALTFKDACFWVTSLQVTSNLGVTSEAPQHKKSTGFSNQAGIWDLGSC